MPERPRIERIARGEDAFMTPRQAPGEPDRFLVDATQLASAIAGIIGVSARPALPVDSRSPSRWRDQLRWFAGPRRGPQTLR